MTFKVTQITDTHLSFDHPERTADLRACIDAINKREVPDIVIHTGDVTHNGLPDEYALAKEILSSLPCSVYAIPGNRDNRENFRQCFTSDGYLESDDKFLQYSISTPHHHLLFLDTLCETSNKGQLCSARLEQFRSMLSHCSGGDKSKRIIVVMHHSPFEATEIPDPRQFVDWPDVTAFGKVVVEYPVIERIICGHVHRNIESVLETEGASHPVPVHALTCLAGDLRKGKVSDEERKQPVFREFLLNQ